MAKSDLDILFVLAPPWGTSVPPLGPAFLVGAARRAGLSAGFVDLNAAMLRALSAPGADESLRAALAEAGGVDRAGDLWAFGNSTPWALRNADRLADAAEPLLAPLWERMATDRPRVLGFSIYGLNLHFSLFLAERATLRFPETKVAFGGPWTAIRPHARLLADSRVDALVFGDGESAVRPLVEILAGGADPPPDWSVERVGDLPILRPPLPELGAQTVPDYDGFDLSLYQPGVFASQIGRGCPNRCRFCSDRTLTACRRRKPEAVFAELADLRARYGLAHVQFSDLSLNGHPRHLRAVLEWMETSLPGVQWDANLAIQPDVNAESAQAMKRSGCTSAQLGLESGSDRVLAAMGKRFDSARAAEAIGLLADAGIRVRVNLLVGFPGEDDEGFAETCDFVRANAGRVSAINTLNTFYLDRGQAIYDQLDDFTLPDPRHPMAGWARGESTFAVRARRFREIRDLCADLGLLDQEIRPEWERDAVEPPAVCGDAGDLRWVFADGRIVLARRFTVLTAGAGLLLDWDEAGARRFSTDLCWSRESERVVTADAGATRWEIRFDDAGDELGIDVFASGGGRLDRLKASLLLADVYRDWAIGERRGPMPPFDFRAPRWEVRGPADDDARLPLADGYAWTGPAAWTVTGDDAPALSFVADADGAVPVLQANCFPGTSVGFYRTAVPLTPEPTRVLRLRLRIG